MLTWDASTWIAVIGVVTSVFGWRAAVWSAWVNQRPSANPLFARTWSHIECFELHRAALLMLINTSRRTLEGTRVEISGLKAIFEDEPQPVRTLLAGYTFLFSEYLPRVEASIRQAGALRDDVTKWHHCSDVGAFIRHGANCRALINEGRVVDDNALYVIKALSQELVRARIKVR